MCHYDEITILYIDILNGIMLRVIMMSVIMLSAIMLSVIMLSAIVLSTVEPVTVLSTAFCCRRRNRKKIASVNATLKGFTSFHWSAGR